MRAIALGERLGVAGGAALAGALVLVMLAVAGATGIMPGAPERVTSAGLAERGADDERVRLSARLAPRVRRLERRALLIPDADRPRVVYVCGPDGPGDLCERAELAAGSGNWEGISIIRPEGDDAPLEGIGQAIEAEVSGRVRRPNDRGEGVEGVRADELLRYALAARIPVDELRVVVLDAPSLSLAAALAGALALLAAAAFIAHRRARRRGRERKPDASP